jgi:hypothetical protein
MSFLRVSGIKIVNEQDEEVTLKGAGLGGWMLYVFPCQSSSVIEP